MGGWQDGRSSLPNSPASVESVHELQVEKRQAGAAS